MPDNGRPMACCPHDGEPMMSTLEFKAAEFYCVVCELKVGYLSPVPKDWTPELQKRHDDLRKIYDAARAERREAASGSTGSQAGKS